MADGERPKEKVILVHGTWAGIITRHQSDA